MAAGKNSKNSQDTYGANNKMNKDESIRLKSDEFEKPFEIQNEIYERFPNRDVFISKSLEKEYLNSVIFNTAELLTELSTNEKIMEERETVLDSIFEDRNNLNAMIQESYEAERGVFYKSFVFSTDKFRSLIEEVIKLYDELEKSLGA